MIWISTLCLLAVAVWLFFNAANERRWVQAHSHDETVASDEGLFASLSAQTGTAMPEGSAKVSVEQENTRFARTVTKVKEKTEKYGERFVESKARAARITDPADRPASASEENTLFGRMVSTVSKRAAGVDDYVEGKIKAAKSQARSTDGAGNNASLFERTSQKVAQKSDEISKSLSNHAKSAAEKGRSAASEEGLFGNVVTKVTSGMESMEQKVQQKLSATSKESSDNKEHSSDDLITRVSAKVGKKINEMDSKSPR